jgi:natural product biosynthesis luciferase-like monooxygenase protein
MPASAAPPDVTAHPHAPAVSQPSEPRLYPLTPVQEGMLLRHLQAPASGTDVQQLVATVHSAIDSAAFCAAWQDVCAAHPALRTRVHWTDRSEPRQEFCAELPPEIATIDLRGLADAEQRARVSAYLTSDRARGFRLDSDAPCRVTLFQQREDRCVWVWSFPHLILDGGSFAAVIADVDTAYAARCAGRAPQCDERPMYGAFLEWLAPELERRRAEAQSFFSEQLRGVTARNAILHRDSHAQEPLPADRNFVDVGDRLTPAATSALRDHAQRCGVTMSTLVSAAWALVVSDYAGGDDDVVFGVVRRGRAGTVPGADRMVGNFISTVPLRITIDTTQPLSAWLTAIRDRQLALRPFEQTAPAVIQACAAVAGGEALFDSIVVFNSATFAAQLPPASQRVDRHFEWIEQTGYPVTLFAYDGPALGFKLSADPAHVSRSIAAGMLSRVVAALAAFARQPAATVGELDRTPPDELARFARWNATHVDVPALLVHQHVEAQARVTPDAIALVHRDASITYGALNARANGVAASLRQHGVRADTLVGVCMERGIDMVVALLGTLKAGGAYVPIDPGYPPARVAMMLEDAAPLVILTQASLAAALPVSGATTLTLDGDALRLAAQDANVSSDATPSSLAYMIFTSGSTGRPKGVLVEHRNVASFFVGMDERLGTTPGVWLAVTSVSFDISVLELFWTLGRGYTVVLQDDASVHAMQRRVSHGGAQGLEFSLFYFAADAGTSTTDRYRLLLDGARYADTHGFTAVWTPERHFHAFGGLYPNPAVTSAAVAAITSRVQLRAGSVVLPLHDPIRIAEEWSVVDNLSNGRVGLSFASGWHANDFALAPGNYATRKAVMFDGMETIRRLWRGESVTVPNGKGETIAVQTLPRPVQREPQFWVSSAGSTETFATSGSIGANLLTNMLGQSMADLETRIGVYRAARRAAGHEGRGHVTLMLHTCIGDDVDAVKRIVREPFMRYLRTSTDLVKQARWEFPAFARPGQDSPADSRQAVAELSVEDESALMAAAFERYFETHGLFGTPESCAGMIQRLKEIGVDEVACLIDFGVDDDTVLASLDGLNRLRVLSNPVADAGADFPVSVQAAANGVTHLQCTPTLAQALLQDADTATALGNLQVLLLGGEALPVALAQRVHQMAPSCRLMNMYGPTETTVWSTSADVDPGAAVTIGRPLANTQVWLLNRRGDVTPPGVPGELCIAGAGVVRGYHDRPELTGERFITRAFGADDAAIRLYRTGDLARWNDDGTLSFLGRDDQQFKLRGHRIELGEIEAALLAHPGVSHAVTVVRPDAMGHARLVSYVCRTGRAGSETEPTAQDLVSMLRAHLAATLPPFMVPDAINVLDAMPRTPNGKIDRTALRAYHERVAPTAVQPSPAPVPGNELERQILAVWQELLGHDRFGVHENFFDLGANSLLMLRAHSQLRSVLGVPVSLVDMFANATIASLAEHLRRVSQPATVSAASAAGTDRAQARRAALQQRAGGRPNSAI